MKAVVAGLLVVLFLIATGACRTTSDTADAPASAGPPFAEVELAESFAPHVSILAGLETAADGESGWRIGDQTLFGIRLDDRDGVSNVWFVRTEVMSDVVAPGAAILVKTGPDRTPTLVDPNPVQFEITMDSGSNFVRTSDSIALEVTVYDADGRETGRSLVGAPARFLSDGLYDSCKAVRALTRESPESEKQSVLTDALLTWVSSFYGFLETFKSSPQLESLRSAVRDEIVQKPPIFSWIFGDGLSIDPDIDGLVPENRPLPARTENDDALFLGTRLLLNDRLAVRLDLVAVDTKPPLQTSAGVIGLEASHPRHPSRKFAARLLAARRGPAPASAP